MEARGKKGTERLYWTTPPHLVSILASPVVSFIPSPLPDKAQPVGGVDGFPYVLDGGEEQAKLAEGKLMEAQASQTKGEDGFLARHVNRRVSRFISKGLVLTPVTPNQITLAGASIGMIGAFLLSWAGYWPKLIGSLLFLFCIIVDGVDGEIARLKLQATSFGHYLDVITDNLVHIAIFVGIALGLYRDSGDPGYLRILWILIGGFGLCGLAVYQCILRRSPEELRQSVKTIRIMAMLSNRDFAYIVVVLALVQRLQWFLIGAAVGTYLFAATLWMTSFYEKRADRAVSLSAARPSEASPETSGLRIIIIMAKRLFIIQPSHYRTRSNLTIHKSRKRTLVPLTLPYLAALTPPDWNVRADRRTIDGRRFPSPR